ncbi:MAG: transporter substrate-binding domain-containing protein [Leptospirales bacterium]
MKSFKRMYSAIFFLLLMVTLPMTGVQDSLFNKVLSKKILRIGISENYPPLSFKTDKNKFDGIEIEMAKSFTTFLEGILSGGETKNSNKTTLNKPIISLEWVLVKPDNYVAKVKNHEVDLLLGGVSRNMSRSQQMWFSEPYYTFTPAVLFDRHKLPQAKYGEFFEERTYRTLWDLKNLKNIKLAVKTGSVYEELIQTRLPNAVIVKVDTNDIGLNKLKARQVDGFVHDSIFFDSKMREEPNFHGNFILLKGGNRKEVLCIGLPMGDTVWLQTVNAWLAEVKRDGQLENWIRKYTEGN